MADYPDWTRLFFLTGTAITIPINVESSDITLDVNLAGSDIQLDVNIAAAAVTLDFNFADQSVAVFDAAKWFAHEAAQIFISGSDTGTIGGSASPCSRVVPAGKVFFVTGMGYVNREATARNVIEVYFSVAGVIAGWFGDYRGGAVIFDTPVRATAGQSVALTCQVYGGAGVYAVGGAFWGYDEDA